MEKEKFAINLKENEEIVIFGNTNVGILIKNENNVLMVSEVEKEDTQN